MALSKWAKGQNGPRVKMGCSCLPPERVEVTVNSKKETNGMVKVGHGSKWAKGQVGLLLFTSCKSRTKNKQLERNKFQGQNGPRDKIGQESRWAAVLYALKEQN